MCPILSLGPPQSAARFYKYALSTIQSPTFYQVQAIYNERDLRALRVMRGPTKTYQIVQLTQDEKASDESFHHERFQIFREMHEVRHFQLVLCIDFWEKCAEPLIRMLEEIAAAEKARGGFDDFFPEPVVSFSPRSYLETVVARWPFKYF